MYKLRITAKARNELKTISRSHQEALFSALAVIEENPLLGKPLTRELTGKFSYRVGLYRIIYKINKRDKIVLIITAGHRSNVYR